MGNSVSVANSTAAELTKDLSIHLSTVNSAKVNDERSLTVGFVSYGLYNTVVKIIFMTKC